MRLRILGAGLALSTLALGVQTAPVAAQQGGIEGTVTDQATGQVLEAARVLITGTNRIETTNRDGKYHFREIAEGSYQIRVLRLGFKPVTDTANVAPGESVTLDFAMEPAPVQLDEIVSTVTGEQRKLELGNAVSTIDAATITQEAPITEFGNLLSGRAAGVTVQKAGGTTGSGTRIRIRGSNSVSLSNEPLYYIDGIRMEAGQTSSSLDIGGFGQGLGAAPSRINDINPEDIESIEIVKGPAAATLYGIQASNGVVRITTKRGRAGRPRWNLYSEVGGVHDANTYPLQYNGRDSTQATGIDEGWDGFCIVQFDLDGTCTQTSVSKFSPLNDSRTTPLKTGLRQQYGANVSGGNDLLTYFLSGDYENEDGVFRLPALEEDSVRSVDGTVPDNQLRPNTLTRLNLRANVGANVSANADIQASIGYISSDARFVENDNSFNTITGSGEASGNPEDVNRGWYFIPAELFNELATQGTERFIGGITGNWRPESWLSTRATLGYDVTNRNDVQFFPTGKSADYLEQRLGIKHDNRFQTTQTSVDLAATARFKLSPDWGSKTSVGGQFFRDLTTGNLAAGFILPAGSETISGAGRTEASDTALESRSLGSYIEQEMALKERLFVTGALRFDDNSA
ncbi:MAG TPA: TonB-dependent receptor plug domain-containing protein, partial [Gemmatimonadales bacterium]|nr:TonB-dependent receptor plug domain-containing protein [Gemmatimonadales bacterium]